jgi:hypothetical protein
MTAVLCNTVLGLSGAARADVILSNLPGNDRSTTFINGPRGGFDGVIPFGSKAAGFTMTTSSDFLLDEVQLRLLFVSANSVPVVALYNTNALGNPGTPLITLTNPPVLPVGAITTFSFLPPAPFTLAAGSTYWIVVSNAATVPDSFLWEANAPSIRPTGLATSAGYRFNNGPPPPVSASSTFNSFAVLATALIPEPSTGLLCGVGMLGLMGVAWWRKWAA